MIIVSSLLPILQKLIKGLSRCSKAILNCLAAATTKKKKKGEEASGVSELTEEI